MAARDGGTGGGGLHVDRAVERALAIAEQRSGLGYGANTPRWARDRALAVLEGMAARGRTSLLDAADELARDRGALEELCGALRVGETRFYRDRAQWDVIARDLVPAIPAGAEIAVLSAGCSTGEEAWTAAMMLTLQRRRFRVLGVDRSGAAVRAAREGIYHPEAARDLPAAWASRFLAASGSQVRIADELRDAVTFEECDLVRRTPRGPFHLVFFKNVLLYLAAPAGEAVAARLAAELDPAGLVFASTSEVLRLRAAGLSPVRLAPAVTAFR